MGTIAVNNASRTVSSFPSARATLYRCYVGPLVSNNAFCLMHGSDLKVVAITLETTDESTAFGNIFVPC